MKENSIEGVQRSDETWERVMGRNKCYERGVWSPETLTLVFPKQTKRLAKHYALLSHIIVQT